MIGARSGCRRLLVAGAAAAALLGACACTKQTAEEVESESVVPVKTEPAVTGSIRGLIHATGVVAPAPGAELIVIAPEPARIAQIPPAEGDRVRQGDVLVRFEIPTLAADVERQAAEVQRAQAQLANANANQGRAHDLFERGIAARKEVEDADRGVADAQAALAQAEAARAAAAALAARSVVRATFNGIIAKRYHNSGDQVEAAASDPVLRVIDPGRIEVVASVPLGDASRLVMGAAARPVGGGPELALRVVSRPTAVEAGTATVPVRLGMAGRTNLPVGTPVEIDIDAEEHSGVVLVPTAAIVREAEETAVFVVEGDHARRRPVEVGLTDGRRTEIRSGVTAGEMVIVDGQSGLPDGATVSIAGAERGEQK
jgi:RND family efflux transporter MFP subunit